MTLDEFQAKLDGFTANNTLGIYPAPWRYSELEPDLEGSVLVLDKNSTHIYFGGDMEENEWPDIATGQLIAAAPDLFDCVLMLMLLQEHQEVLDEDTFTTVLNTLFLRARFALIKAGVKVAKDVP